MPRTPSSSLTDGETRLMAVLWQKGEATVGEIVRALKGYRPVSYSTVQTMMRILEQKGYAVHEKTGRAFVYRPLISKQQARRRALADLLARLFDNSPSELVLNVIEDGRLDRAEIARLKKLIDDA
jgi:predicted transcriptional regulator